MTSTIPALAIAKMRPLSLRAGMEADYFKMIEYLLDQLQSQIGITAGGIEDPRIDALILDVASLENSLDLANDNIAVNVADITTNEGDISTNAGNISTNTSNISTNTANITAILARLFDSVIVVREAADFGTIDSTKTYYVDGQVDMGSTSITVPAGGITLSGFGFNISRLFSSENSYTMFTGATAGDVFIAGQGLTLEASGTGSNVFELTNSSGVSAIETNFVNFENCTEIGYLDGYRQLLMRNVGIFGCADGLELRGTWSGGARVTDFIVRNFGSSGTIFKEGAGLTFGSRFSLVANIDMPSGTSSVADFQSSNFDNDSSFQVSDGFYSRNGAIDINDANYFPNLAGSSVASFWLGNTGIRNTVIGGAWESSIEATTVVAASSTFYKLAGTTVSDGLDHMDAPADNRLRLIVETPTDISLFATIKIEQATGFGDEIQVRARIYKDAAATFEEIRTVSAVIPNLSALDNVVQVTLAGRVDMEQNDYIELWVSNESGSGNLIMKEGSFMQLRRT